MWEKFLEAVDRHFRFLEVEFGFTRKATKPPNVIYESDTLSLIILYDVSRGHELDLVIRRASDSPRKPLSLGIDTLIRFTDGARASGYAPSFPRTEDTLATEVKRLAELLRKCGSAVLSGDLHAFDRLEQDEKNLARKFGRKQP